MSKVALVLGGTGNIGSACVKLLIQDADYKYVVITSRSQEKIEKIKEAMKTSLTPVAAAKIVGVVGKIGEEKSAASMKEKVITAVGEQIDTVISVMGFPYLNLGPLISVTQEQMEDVYKTQFFAAFGGYKTFMPMVISSLCGTYIFVSGGGPDMYLGPGTGVMTIGGSAATALAKIAMKEHNPTKVCCTEVAFHLGICPDPSVMPPPHVWLSTTGAGQALISVASKRKAPGKSLNVCKASDMQSLIDNGIDEKIVAF